MIAGKINSAGKTKDDIEMLAEKIIKKTSRKIGCERKTLRGKIKNFLICALITLFVTLIILVAGLYAVMWICVNGPSDRARYLFVTSVKESSAAGFLAELMVPGLEVEHILHSGETTDMDENTDLSLIKIPDEKDNIPGNNTATETEKKIEIVDVSGPTYKGKMAIIKDPSKVKVGVSGEYGSDRSGKKLEDIVKDYNGVLGVNASGFEDRGGNGNGGSPIGIVISDGKLLCGSKNKSYGIIGFDENNILIVDTMTAQQALDKGIRDAASFGPVLVKNGQPVYKNGGMNPRTAIGQRTDGAVLLLVIEGRQVSSIGATMRDLTNIMLDYGAVNAANLDGGSSSSLYYNGEYVIEGSYVFGVRKIPNAFIVTSE